jgi:hypothetical protein
MHTSSNVDAFFKQGSINIKTSQTQEELFQAFFGTAELIERTTGFNGGKVKGAEYNAFMLSLGFDEMETNLGKPVIAFGPQLKLGIAWTPLGRFRTSIGMCTFYHLKRSERIVILRTSSGNKGLRSVFTTK